MRGKVGGKRRREQERERESNSERERGQTMKRSAAIPRLL